MKLISLIVAVCLSFFCISIDAKAQETSIKELEFLIGTWEVKEVNTEKNWWEKATRVARYTLDSTYIELISHAVSSNGKERTYLWMIHYNTKAKQFEMVSMFGNWHKVQFDILKWDRFSRKLTIRHSEDVKDEFHERFGEIVFNENFDQYTWTGENKYGDPTSPGIWRYVETGNKSAD